MLIVDSTWNGRCYKKMRCLVIVPKTGGLGLRAVWGHTYVIADGINTLLCRFLQPRFDERGRLAIDTSCR